MGMRGDLNASQTGPNTRGDALTDRTVEAAVTRVLLSKFGISPRSMQQLQDLAGTGDKEAVRHQDLAALKGMRQMTAQKVSAPPTADEHNALVSDVAQLFEAMSAIAQALGL